MKLQTFRQSIRTHIDQPVTRAMIADALRKMADSLELPPAFNRHDGDPTLFREYRIDVLSTNPEHVFTISGQGAFGDAFIVLEIQDEHFVKNLASTP